MPFPLPQATDRRLHADCRQSDVEGPHRPSRRPRRADPFGNAKVARELGEELTVNSDDFAANLVESIQDHDAAGIRLAVENLRKSLSRCLESSGYAELPELPAVI